MRTDCTIDKKQVRCPNASTLGFGKYNAQVGDLVFFREGTQRYAARMIGRIAYANSTSDSGWIKNYILGVVLNPELSHTYERWINPADVDRVETVTNEYQDRRAVLDWFLSDEMVKAPIDEVRQSTTQGWSTLAKYRANMAERKAAEVEFAKRHVDCESTPCEFCTKFRLRGATEVK